MLATLTVSVLSADDDKEIKPNGKGQTTKPAGSHANPQSPTGIDYHGGPLLTAGPNVYVIWYGAWTQSAQQIIEKFLTGLNHSSWFNINSTYYSQTPLGTGPKVFVTNQINVKGFISDSYSHGKSLSDSGVAAVVAGAFTGSSFTGNQTLPVDTNGVYFVLTSSDVNETSGFCTQYCGWHDWGTLRNGVITIEGGTGTNIKFAFVGNPERCPSACTNGTLPPNGNVGADGAVSIIAHELSEATTDPNLNAWYDRRGNENADKCAWIFGTTHTVPAGQPNAGGVYNITLSTGNYLVQQNWLNIAPGGCVSGY